MTDRIGQKPGADAALERLRMLMIIAYVCYALGLMLGFWPFMIGLILLYLKRDEARGTLYESHAAWLIRTFWLGLLFGLIGLATFLLVGLGYVILIGTGIWIVYRIVKGGLALSEGKPLPDPDAWL